jgi:hypothetical protein
MNIQWARDGYPVEKIQKLNEREEKCKKLKAEKVMHSADDLSNFFKLSHPANPKIPFIIDCLELRKTEEFGRGIYATQDLAAGDIISIEDAVIRMAFTWPDAELYRCANCLNVAMLNLVPCTKTCKLNIE